ncbi:hypothetical protein NQ314_014916 [Rhamnusium bicolor]|uniref:Uncharacterized protein n=1 Tax=Rhamnusium bicolor TaxID=1586634 RepID=A0AAV8X152_9CUCU|nr:hypothetical protein NQ314_014916 [Rhamnusium bicolor]
MLGNHLPENEKVNLKKVHDSCQANPATYVDEDILRKLNDNINHKQAGIHMLCMSVKAGLQKANGDLDIGVIRSKIDTVLDDKSKVEGFVSKCAVKKESPQKTAVLLWLCFVLNDIPYFHKL